MKKVLALAVALILLLSVSGCSSAPSEVSSYATKHRLEVLSMRELSQEAVVGEKYVVYGKVSSISAQADGRSTDYIIMFEDMGPALRYECTLVTDRLNINKGDEVAFVVVCEEVFPGYYDYSVKKKIWESRHSEKTIEEERFITEG